MNNNSGLLGYWKLKNDCLDYSGRENHGIGHGVRFDEKESFAVFDGKQSHIEVPDDSSLQLGSTGFSVSVWIDTKRELDDLIGDILCKYDPEKRTGFSLGVLNHSGAVQNQSNYRNLHFGLDNSIVEPNWTDCGRPGNSRFVYALTVGGGDLYAATAEPGKDDTGGVYRYNGKGEWIDCHIPVQSNAVRSLAYFQGNLYAGSAIDSGAGSQLTVSPNNEPGGNVYRYEGGSTWVDCGKPGNTDATSVPGLHIFIFYV